MYVDNIMSLSMAKILFLPIMRYTKCLNRSNVLGLPTDYRLWSRGARLPIQNNVNGVLVPREWDETANAMITYKQYAAENYGKSKKDCHVSRQKIMTKWFNILRLTTNKVF